MKRTVIRDCITGLSVAGLMLPEGVAYAGIAGLSPGRALAAGIAGGLTYAVIGRSRFAIISPTSSSAAILAAALAGLSRDPATREMMATALVAIAGCIFLALSLFRLGSLASFISRPVLRGFAFGLALTIIVRQLPKLAGVAVPPGPIWAILQGLAAHLAQWHFPSLALGALSLAVLLVLRRFPLVPAALLLIVAGIGLSSCLDLAHYGIGLAGTIALSPPSFALPATFQVWAQLTQLAIPISLILFAETWGTERALALKHGDALAPDRELAAIGLANLASAAAQGMPVGAGFSAGSANEAAGAASRLAGAIASFSLLLLALFAGRWISRIPEPVLAAVVIAALTHALSLAPFAQLYRIRRDFWIALAAAAGVLLLGVLNGMLAAVALSIADLLYDLSHPSVSELGQVGKSHDFVDVARHAEAHPVAGVAIYRPNAPLMFANAESVLGAIAAKARKIDAPTVIVSLEESNDLDSTAIEALGEMASVLAKAGKRLILARAHDRVRDVLAVAGLTRLSINSTYSVADAVHLATKGD